MKNRRHIAAFLAALGLTSCQTITIVNSKAPARATTEKTMWHHTGIFGLVTYSGEHRVEELCNGGTWNSVTTERGVGPSLVEAGFQMVQYVPTVAAGAGSLVSAANFFWDPLTLTWTCIDGEKK